jgi:hypothetical protein
MKQKVPKPMVTVITAIGLGLIGREQIGRTVGRPKHIDRALFRPKRTDSDFRPRHALLGSMHGQHIDMFVRKKSTLARLEPLYT